VYYHSTLTYGSDRVKPAMVLISFGTLRLGLGARHQMINLYRESTGMGEKKNKKNNRFSAIAIKSRVNLSYSRSLCLRLALTSNFMFCLSGNQKMTDSIVPKSKEKHGSNRQLIILAECGKLKERKYSHERTAFTTGCQPVRKRKKE